MTTIDQDSIKNELSQISLKEAQFWSQRKQKLWIKDGDENTSFFHRICTAKQKRNSNFEIVDDDGIPHNSNVTIANTFINYFSTLFKGEKIKRIFMENLDWPPIPSSESSNLCAPFQEDEVKAMIQYFEGNKALVLDDFPLLFNKKYWQFLKVDIMEVFKEFHDKGITNKNMNNTFIALIAKKKDYTMPKYFRPISLTTSLYKIIAKTLANGLSPTLSSTVSKNQLAFVEGR